MILFRASGRSATADTDDRVTTGSVGIPVVVELSDEFDGLAATMVFRAGDEYADVALGFENPVSVPPQCLYKAGSTLRIGVYAEDGNRNVVIPTVWASVCTIRQGAERSGVDPAEPTPSWAAQVQQWAEDAHDTAERLAEEVDGWETAENGRVSAESGRVSAENGRAAAESQRESAELVRVLNEAGRVSAETARQAAESERASEWATIKADAVEATEGAENVNANASKSGDVVTISVTDRTGSDHVVTVRDGVDGVDGYSPTVEITDSQSAHTVTITDVDGPHSYTVTTYADEEQARATAEAQRASAEAARATAESARASAESARVTAEAARATAEQGRQSAEGARSTAEATRVQAESQRASSESQRVAAEASRVTAEASRVTAESDRANAWDQLSQDAQDAIDAATEAAESVSDDVDALYNGVVQLFANQLTGEMSGTIDTASDAYAAPPMALTVGGASTQAGTPTPDAPVPILSVDDLALEVHGKNLCGGSALLTAVQSAMPAAITGSDADGSYVSFTGANAGTSGTDVVTDVFKPSTQYTAIIKGANKTANTTLNLRFVYTDGTFTRIESIGDVDVVRTLAVSSDASKTVKSVQACWITGTTRLYYDQCGIFEGVYALADFVPYIGTTVPLYNGTLRSLPDGTKDTLSLSYLRPSTRAGWAWYSRELVQNVMRSELTAEDVTSTTLGGDPNSRGIYNSTLQVTTAKFNELFTNRGPAYNNYVRIALATVGVSNYAEFAAVTDFGIAALTTNHRIYLRTSEATDENFIAALFAAGPIVMNYAADTPVTTQLDPIELPELPAPDCTVFCDGGSAIPTFQMEYVQDTNLVIADLRAAIADLATS